MATQRWRITADYLIDTEVLAGHDGEKQPPPNDVAEWYGGDISTAVAVGIAEVDHSPVTAELVGTEE